MSARIILVLLLLPGINSGIGVYGQAVESTLFTFEWDNDLFMHTDMYYTNGVELRLYNGIKGVKAIDNLISFPYKKKKAGQYRSYYSAKQEMFTPSNIQDSLIRAGDRPYAGTLLLSYGTQYISKNRMIWSELTIGILGKYAFSEQTQNSVHEVLKVEPGNGWDHQVSSAFLINYTIGMRKHFYQSKWQQSGYITEGSLGLYQTRATFGLYYQLGNYETNYGERAVCDGNDDKLKISLSVASKLHLVVYDATLHGGVSGPERPVHRINFESTSNLVSEFEIGLTYSYKHISSTMKFNFTTPEFSGASSHAWGHIGIGFRF